MGRGGVQEGKKKDPGHDQDAGLGVEVAEQLDQQDADGGLPCSRGPLDEGQ